MKYDDFYFKFGGSYRGKHCKKRGVALPAASLLPREFIRLDPWEGEYLWSVAQNARVGVLEIGRRNGGSTFLLSCATNAPIVSIDNAPADDALLRGLFARHSVGGNVELIVGDSRVATPEPAAIDLLFVDGDHSYAGCRADLLAWSGRVVPGGHIVFHDSYSGSYGVQLAAEDFIENNSDFDEMVSSAIEKDHWKYEFGSIAHYRRMGLFNP